MQKSIIIGFLIIVIFIFVIFYKKEQKIITTTNMMEIKSSQFANGQSIPIKYTCDGLNINPPLSFSNVPENTKSLVLIMDDPDAPVGTWDHWIIFNLSPETKEIKENSLPAGQFGLNSFQKTDYGGPCPPDREHRYFFKLYALDIVLSIKSGAPKKEIEQALRGHILEQAEIIGQYERKI